MNGPKQLLPGERISIRLTPRDRDLILNHTYLGGDLEGRIRIAPADGSGVIVGLTLDDLDELMGYVAAEANHSTNPRLQKQLDMLYARLRQVEDGHTDEQSEAFSQSTASDTKARYTPKQGQYLLFIYYYTKIHGRPPSESEMQHYFGVAAPTVHQMMRTLEVKGLIGRTPGKARSIRLMLPRGELPDLE